MKKLAELGLAETNGKAGRHPIWNLTPAGQKSLADGNELPSRPKAGTGAKAVKAVRHAEEPVHRRADRPPGEPERGQVNRSPAPREDQQDGARAACPAVPGGTLGQPLLPGRRDRGGLGTQRTADPAPRGSRGLLALDHERRGPQPGPPQEGPSRPPRRNPTTSTLWASPDGPEARHTCMRETRHPAQENDRGWPRTDRSPLAAAVADTLDAYDVIVLLPRYWSWASRSCATTSAGTVTLLYWGGSGSPSGQVSPHAARRMAVVRPARPCR